MADQEYTITFNGGAVLLDYIEFESATTTKVSDTIKAATSITDTTKGLNDRFAVRTAGGIYIVHLLTDSDITSGSKLTFTGTSGTPIETSTVYSSVSFGTNDVLNASDVGAAALYAVKATNVSSIPSSSNDIHYNWTITK